MSKEFELKPCPFCGGKAEFHRQSDCTLDYIICTKCELYLDMEKFDSVDELINHWNHRPSPWISTAKESLPERKEMIIALEYENQYEFDIAMLYDGSWITMSRIILFDSDVKYVMPIPELPKE